jgi:hypothetical protein
VVFAESRVELTRVPAAEICLICLKEIEPTGSDPCRVKVIARDEHASWEWPAHEACIRAALHPDVQAEAGGELD